MLDLYIARMTRRSCVVRRNYGGGTTDLFFKLNTDLFFKLNTDLFFKLNRIIIIINNNNNKSLGVFIHLERVVVGLLILQNSRSPGGVDNTSLVHS